MPVDANTIDSNVTGLRFSEEASLCTLAGSPIFYPLEPNSYDSFGAEYSTVPRNPINDSRQRKKGVLTDLDADGGFTSDLTQENFQDIGQGFFFADARTKVEFGGSSEITNVDGTSEEYDAASGLDAFQVGNLVFASGFTNTENNGLKRVTGASATALTVAEDLVDETPPAGAKLVEVGFQGLAGDIDVDASGSLPILTSTSLDFTTLGLIVGEFIYIGGDTAATAFATAANNGYARIKSIAANALTLDKTENTMVTEASTTETVQIFTGRVLKNESLPANQVTRSYHLERTLGIEQGESEAQAEYLVGAIANEWTLNLPTADKATMDLSFVAVNYETRASSVGPKSTDPGASAPTIEDADAFNTSSDVKLVKMAVVDPADSNPTPLFTYITDTTVTINNNVTANKAVGTLGAIGVTAGNFEVSGDLTVYFERVSANDAIRNNSDVTLEYHLAKANAGISIDLPLLTLGDGRINVEQDAPITLPISQDAASGAKLDTNLDHTLLMVFFDYLPNAATA